MTAAAGHKAELQLTHWCRTVYLRQGRFFIAAVTVRPLHLLPPLRTLPCKVYTSGRFTVREELQWLDQQNNQGKLACDTDAVEMSLPATQQEGLSLQVCMQEQEQCSMAVDSGSAKSAALAMLQSSRGLKEAEGQQDSSAPDQHQQQQHHHDHDHHHHHQQQQHKQQEQLALAQRCRDEWDQHVPEQAAAYQATNQAKATGRSQQDASPCTRRSRRSRHTGASTAPSDQQTADGLSVGCFQLGCGWWRSLCARLSRIFSRFGYTGTSSETLACTADVGDTAPAAAQHTAADALCAVKAAAAKQVPVAGKLGLVEVDVIGYGFDLVPLEAHA